MKIIKEHIYPDTSNSILTIKDIILVVLSVFGVSVLFLIIGFLLFGTKNKIAFRLFHYIFSFSMILIPPFWIKKKYGLGKEVLGLKKGKLNHLSQIGIGVAIGLTVSFSFRILSLLLHLSYQKPFTLRDPHLVMHLVLLPLSIDAFPIIILAPFAEEILIRGFIYEYLRKKQGIAIGLFSQALIFALLHFQNFYNMVSFFIIGVILGLLYERTESLYPSIICHATINYLVFLYGINLI
jgi:membrane protease YdiL (CAAX protease family)